ncbi:hypothetical protein [Inhella inkyongensis]|uniref:hypothetical protein n=1 Tax=Inhella inkyongensis TaxID=392593 RepID=UPI00158689BB|nr:hypothetical protein [Inhella inkyongensis]
MLPDVRITSKVLGLLLLFSFQGCESEQSKAEKAYQQKYAKAKALFEERCQTAGVVIHRTVRDVEGIELTKVRPKLEWADKRYFDPMFEGAAMAGENQGDDFIKQFLMSEFLVPDRPNERSSLGPPTQEKKRSGLVIKKGYAFVEYIDASARQRFMCRPDWSLDHPNWVPGQHHCTAIERSSTRYALDYEDIVTPADRALWVAGTRLKVIDKQSGETIATFTKFVWDPGFGVSTTGRWPWQHADGRGDRNCPYEQFKPTSNDSRYFVDTVLIPKQGD